MVLATCKISLFCVEMWKPLLVLALMFWGVQGKCACSRRREKPQEKFCKADYVIRAKVVKLPRITVGSLHRNRDAPLPRKVYLPQIFTLRLLKAYKGAMKLNTTEGFELHGVARGRNVRVQLFTPSKADSCRVKLRLGRIYLFGGHISKKKLSVSRCSWISVWKKMSSRKKEKLLTYRRMCKCKGGLKYEGKCKNQKMKRKEKRKRIKKQKKRRHWKQAV